MHARLGSALLVAERDITSFSHTGKGKRPLLFFYSEKEGGFVFIYFSGG